MKVRNNFIQFLRLVFLDNGGHRCPRFPRQVFLDNGGHLWPRFLRLVFLDNGGHQYPRFLRLVFLDNGGHLWPRFLRQLFLDNRCRTSSPTSTINLWSFTPQVTLWFKPCGQAICFYTKKKGDFPFTSFNRCQAVINMMPANLKGKPSGTIFRTEVGNTGSCRSFHYFFAYRQRR